MNHPFRQGDTVYHPLYGMGEVYQVGVGTVRVHYRSGERRAHSDMNTLSFTEWPKAQHVRPVKAGYHLVQGPFYADVAYCNGSDWSWVDADGKPASDGPADPTSIKYLGDTWDAVMALEPV